MSAIKSVLNDEQKRLKQLRNNYRKEISSLPKGSILKKVINKIPYAYIISRNGLKVNTDYIGKWGSEKHNKIKAQIDKRKGLAKRLSSLVKDIKEMDKFLIPRKKRSING